MDQTFLPTSEQQALLVQLGIGGIILLVVKEISGIVRSLIPRQQPITLGLAQEGPINLMTTQLSRQTQLLEEIARDLHGHSTSLVRIEEQTGQVRDQALRHDLKMDQAHDSLDALRRTNHQILGNTQQLLGEKRSERGGGGGRAD